MWFFIVIFIFAAVGITLVVRGFRGRSIACDPVCASCGYDIRGYAVMARCTECGSDLTVAGGIRADTFQASRKKIMGGLLVMAFPFFFGGVLMLLDALGPDWERVRSNRSLIAEIDSNKIFGPGRWGELSRRMASGRLTPPEVTAVVHLLIADLKDRAAMGSWSRQFFVEAHRAGVITGPEYLAIAQAYYQTPLKLRFPTSLSSGSPSHYSIYAWPPVELSGVHRVVTIQEISMSEFNATPGKIDVWAGLAAPPLQTVNLLTQIPGLLAAAAVPPGKYQIKLVLQISLVSGNGPLSVSTQPPSGPPPLAQWTETHTLPMQIFK